MPAVVREREVLRVTAAIATHSADATAFETARAEVLKWAQKRCGGQLPPGAWAGDNFELMLGGRTTLGAHVVEDGRDLWALRADDPDKTVAGRVWTTEVALGKSSPSGPQLGLRLLLSTGEDDPPIEPAVPGLLRQISDRVGLTVEGQTLSPDPWSISDEQEVDQLIALLQSPRRRLPVIVAAGDERDGVGNAPPFHLNELARAALGLARVVFVPARFTYALSDAFGKRRSVYHGAVRLYLEDFGEDADAYDHPLILGDAVRADPKLAAAVLRQRVAAESLRRTMLGREVLPFAAVRSVALRVEQETITQRGATSSDLLRAAERRIEALQAELKGALDLRDVALDETHDEENRRKELEYELRGANARIVQLEKALQSRDQAIEDDLGEFPTKWSDLADWCSRRLANRLVLAPAARKGIKAPDFADVNMAARCLLWLGEEYRDRRLNDGGSMNRAFVTAGIENAPCGGDAYGFTFNGKPFRADWHLKNGANTRDRARCLRIYCAWDEDSRRVIVSDMPAHRRTGAT